MNFNETIKKYNYVVFVCRTMHDFISLRINFEKRSHEFWNSVKGYDLAKEYISREGNISFDFIDGMYDGYCRKNWFLKNNRRIFPNEWKIIDWVTFPTIIEVDDE
ncbi:MAG TPA: hypothetical protein PK151_06920 [Caldisericia bacterium]|nr:hypothetical protein [Caldisericia bacterium]